MKLPTGKNNAHQLHSTKTHPNIWQWQPCSNTCKLITKPQSHKPKPFILTAKHQHTTPQEQWRQCLQRPKHKLSKTTALLQTLLVEKLKFNANVTVTTLFTASNCNSSLHAKHCRANNQQIWLHTIRHTHTFTMWQKPHLLNPDWGSQLLSCWACE